MTTAIDTNVLADIQVRDPQFFAASVDALEQAAARGALIVGEVVYGELAAKLSTDELDAFFHDLGIQFVPSSQEALGRAGQAFGRYLATRGREVQCPACGHGFQAVCPACHEAVAWRQHFIPDFLVGAHAELHAGTLLTRDRGIYGRYFPRLALAA